MRGTEAHIDSYVRTSVEHVFAGDVIMGQEACAEQWRPVAPRPGRCNIMCTGKKGCQRSDRQSAGCPRLLSPGPTLDH
eukprot:9468576-Pyramimonas_sp.AAC.1